MSGLNECNCVDGHRKIPGDSCSGCCELQGCMSTGDEASSDGTNIWTSDTVPRSPPRRPCRRREQEGAVAAAEGQRRDASAQAARPSGRPWSPSLFRKRASVYPGEGAGSCRLLAEKWSSVRAPRPGFPFPGFACPSGPTIGSGKIGRPPDNNPAKF